MTARHLWALAAGAAALSFAAALALPVPQRQTALVAILLLPVALLLHRRAPHLSLVLNAATLGLGAFLSAGIVDTALRESRSLAEAEHLADRMVPMVQDLAPQVLKQPDLPAVLAMMHELERLKDAGKVSDSAIPFVFDAPLRAAVDGMRGRALANILQPHLVLWLEQRLRQAPDSPERTMSLLIPYLYVGGKWSGRREVDDIIAGIDRELALSAEAGMDDRLASELAAYLADETWSSPSFGASLDTGVIDDARLALRGHSATWLAYLLIKDTAQARGLPDLLLTDMAGAGAAEVFERRSGQPLDTPIPGFYTHAGFVSVFLPALASLPDTLLTVLALTDLSPPALAGEAAMRQAEADLVSLYENDMIAAWDGLLSDLRLRGARTPLALERQMRLLASPDSPLENLVRAVAAETLLSALPTDFSGLRAKVSEVATKAAAAESGGVWPGAGVEAHFAPLQAVLAPDASGLSTLDLLRETFGLISDEIGRGELGLGGITGTGLPPDHPATLRLRSLAETLPPPLPGWFLPPP